MDNDSDYFNNINNDNDSNMMMTTTLMLLPACSIVLSSWFLSVQDRPEVDPPPPRPSIMCSSLFINGPCNTIRKVEPVNWL